MTLDEILVEIKKAENVLVLAHEAPDGDAIGSSLAMCLALRNMDKNAVVLMNNFPENYSFLPGTEFIKTESEIDKYDLFKYIENDNVIRIKNCTEPNIDLEELSSNNTLKGIFATKMKEKLENEHDEEQKQIIKNAIEVGLKVLK